MDGGFFELSVSLQVALASGYLAYVTAYAGLRSKHSTQDAFFISLAFSAVALMTFDLIQIEQTYLKAATACAVALLSAVLWRKAGHPVWLWLMRSTGVHREDGSHAAWDVLVQTDRKVGQVSVHLKDGRVLYLHDRRKFLGCAWDGLYLGGDGSVIMVVESEELPSGAEEVRQAVCDDVWGARMTYLPAAEIARVNLRMK